MQTDISKSNAISQIFLKSWASLKTTLVEVCRKYFQVQFRNSLRTSKIAYKSELYTCQYTITGFE